MRTRKRNEGTALIFAIAVLAILSIGTSVLWQQLHRNLDQHRMAWHQEQVFLIAEAGLESALAQLQHGPVDYDGEAQVAVGSGHFTVVVTPGDGTGHYRLRSTGRLEHAAYRYDVVTLSATVRLSPAGDLIAYAWHIDREGAPL